MNPNQAWKVIVEDIRGQVTRPSFTTWFLPLRDAPVELAGDVLTVRAPNEFAANQVMTLMYSMVQKTAERVLGRPVEVVVVASAAEPSPAKPAPKVGEPVNVPHHISLRLRQIEAWLNEECDRGKFPPTWRKNIRSFLTNQAALRPYVSAWEWLLYTIKRYDVRQPFGWVKAVLANPRSTEPLEGAQFRLTAPAEPESLTDEQKSQARTLWHEATRWHASGNLTGFVMRYKDQLEELGMVDWYSGGSKGEDLGVQTSSTAPKSSPPNPLSPELGAVGVTPPQIAFRHGKSLFAG